MPIVYCIECNITGEKYYGSTKSTLNVRMSVHTNINNRCCSKEILLRDDYVVYTLEEFDTIEEARLKEGWYIDNNECINERRVSLTDEERKEYHIKQCKKYREKNKEQINEKSKEYRQENKEQIREKAKEKVECEFCKFIGRKGDLKRHQRSKRCKQFQ